MRSKACVVSFEEDLWVVSDWEKVAVMSISDHLRKLLIHVEYA